MMNRCYIYYILGRLVQVLGVLLIVPVIVGIFYNNGFRVLLSFGISILICILVGGFISRKEPEDKEFYAHEGLVLVALAWFVYLFWCFSFCD